MSISCLAMLAVLIEEQGNMLDIFGKNILKRGSCDESNEAIRRYQTDV